MTRDELLEACFGRSTFPPGVKVVEMLDERTGDVLSHIDVYLRQVRIRHPEDQIARGVGEAATTLTVVALAQVCTDPAHRRKGYASALVRGVHTWATDHKPVKFAALFSGVPEFYVRLGYFHPEGATRDDFLVRALTDEKWPAGRATPIGDW